MGHFCCGKLGCFRSVDEADFCCVYIHNIVEYGFGLLVERGSLTLIFNSTSGANTIHLYGVVDDLSISYIVFWLKQLSN
jgi:hypothetical protein